MEALTGQEIKKAVEIIRTEKKLSQYVRFVTVTLKEPVKDIVLNYEAGDNITREAFMILLDNKTEKTYEATVSITKGKVTSWEYILNVQSGVMLDEFEECEQVVKNSPEFQEALLKRGITDSNLVMVDPWSAGYFGIKENEVECGLSPHFFNFRLDTMLDGSKNSVVEINTLPEEEGPNNPYSNAFYIDSKTFKTEEEAKRNLDMATQRTWKIINPNSLNAVGTPVGYKIMPGENCLPFAGDNSSVMKRAGFLKNQLHVTPYDPNEMYATGNYPNQHKGGEGLPKYTAANRNIENEDVVVWYTMGHHHITRPEDWPVMPTAYINFQLKPVGFFDRNPALDLPRPKPKTACNSKNGSNCH